MKLIHNGEIARLMGVENTKSLHAIIAKWAVKPATSVKSRNGMMKLYDLELLKPYIDGWLRDHREAATRAPSTPVAMGGVEAKVVVLQGRVQELVEEFNRTSSINKADSIERDRQLFICLQKINDKLSTITKELGVKETVG